MSEEKAGLAASAAGGAGRGHWASRTGFILAAAGSAVGLGNIWKFPYITGENGGGLFVLIYLACIALVGLPIMVAEIMIGRAARKQPVVAFQVLQGRKTAWSAIGWLGMITGFIILSYYVVVAGWAAAYTLSSLANFTHPIAQQADQASRVYRASTSPQEMRRVLAEASAQANVTEEIKSIRSEAGKGAWDALGVLQASLAEAGSTSSVATEEAERRLLEDEEFAEKIKLARGLEKRIGEAKAKALEEANARYAALADERVRDEAQTHKRRAVVAEKVGATFSALASDGWVGTFWAALFMVVTILVVAGGVSSGIERACRILMPLLICIMLFMVVYGVFQPGFGSALSFVFSPDPSKLKVSGVLEALGHAFFTLSLGMGAMITYGSYQEEKEDLLKQSMWIAGLDTMVALLACLMMFPIIFSYGQEPAAGPGLVFKSMPLAFAEMGRGGLLLAIIFFGLLVVAALTSAISLLEVVSSYFIDQHGWTRRRAAWSLGGIIFLFAIPSAFSYDSDFVMAGWSSIFGMPFFDLLDYLASNWLLPLGGLLIAIYAGWFLPQRFRDAELEGLAPWAIQGWLMLIRLLAPALVFLVLLQKVGIIQFN